MTSGRDGGEAADSITPMANCLVTLSRGGQYDAAMTNFPRRVFECKTCNRFARSIGAAADLDTAAETAPIRKSIAKPAAPFIEGA
ncbi:hypothetical protein RJ639_014217 [Escallonia herrerae]|uniref:Uncharacterized protein n=1 Tax=Escallonia herrerae TaxID=1293975 RepID=A0AA88VIL6_9ASTE|nr:hypothetical protein RJ639_014217 [Escallonia herrerae]